MSNASSVFQEAAAMSPRPFVIALNGGEQYELYPRRTGENFQFEITNAASLARAQSDSWDVWCFDMGVWKIVESSDPKFVVRSKSPTMLQYIWQWLTNGFTKQA